MSPEERADAIVSQAAAAHLGWREQRELIARAILGAETAAREEAMRQVRTALEPRGDGWAATPSAALARVRKLAGVEG